MAIRNAWSVDEKGYIIKEVFKFEWNSGFTISQKKKNIKNLHQSINGKYNKIALEVSTKSDEDLGVMLSAFNLKLNGYFLENVFQSSKVYEKGGPYLDLLNTSPVNAKRDIRHTNSGNLIGFIYSDQEWNLLPRTAFYDYIYASAALQSIDIDKLSKILSYDYFTDIEFNPNKSINCQARSVAILKRIIRDDLYKVLNTSNEWIDFHKICIKG